nr:MAG TPA: LEUCOCIN A PEPTIDE, BACTERIOCIN [Caudoviricetes sp.]DAS91015.1 MAG TPA: LEUCOCIN A PEPTIDE, BACTERIOCIN [Caudoviricetes sp.]DAU09718.1 MAG TPA: LEUCOCIN A PEPTIDE, BACTERIOCIN [Caudoviricetes sp.]
MKTLPPNECQTCSHVRHCINGLYCTKKNTYVQYAKIEDCQLKYH